MRLLKRSALRRASGRAAAVAVLLCTDALAQHADAPTRSEDSDSYREIVLAQPQLPNRPARRENINDEEVREIQKVALEVYPYFIVVISSVTDGCACEEGAHCSAQVALALNRNNVTRSLILSRVDEHWKVGAVQSWWFKYVSFERTHPAPTTWDARRAWQQEREALFKQFPACPVPAANWMLLRNASYGSTYVDTSSMTVSGFIRRVNVKHASNPPAWKPSPGWTGFSIAVEAFDCRDRRERIDKMTLYLEDGTAVQTAVKDPVLWEPIRPDTVSSKDLDLVCSWKARD